MNALKIEVLRFLRKSLETAHEGDIFMCTHLNRMQHHLVLGDPMVEVIIDVKNTITNGLDGCFTFSQWLDQALLADGGPTDYIDNEVFIPYLEWRSPELLRMCRLAWVDRMLADEGVQQ